MKFVDINIIIEIGYGCVTLATTWKYQLKNRFEEIMHNIVQKDKKWEK